MKYIAIQLFGLISTVLYFVSYQCRDNKKLFRFQFLSYLIYTIHFLLLGAITGGISYIINMFRSIFLGCDWKPGRSKAMCVFLCALQGVTLIFTWDGWLSLLPIVANIASTIGGYTYNPRKIRAAGIFVNSPLWLVHNIFVGSWAGVLDEIISESSMIISVVRFGWKNLDRVENEMYSVEKTK